jgi:hypothetical protein
LYWNATEVWNPPVVACVRLGVAEVEMATSGHGEGAAETRTESSSARGASAEAGLAREAVSVEAGAAEGAAARAGSGSSSAGVTREGIYQFADAKAGGKPYVGQSGDVPTRLDQHAAAGRHTTGEATVTPVSGGKTAREVAEHRQIQKLTGGVPARKSPNVANKVDPIGPKRQELLKKD